MTDASDENSSGPVGENDQLIVSSADTGAREPATGTDPALFIAMKAATLFLFVILAAADVWPCFGGFLALSVALVEFWITKNINGLNLVGMRWSHEVGDSGDPRWIFYSRRDPYVPEPANSAIFWAVMFGAALTWVAVALTAVFLWSFFYALVAAVILAFEVVNTSCFVKCHAVSNRQADDVARAVLLGSPFDDGGEADTQLVVDEPKLNPPVYNHDTQNLHIYNYDSKVFYNQDRMATRQGKFFVVREFPAPTLDDVISEYEEEEEEEEVVESEPEKQPAPEPEQEEKTEVNV